MKISFEEFIQESFKIINPGTEFLPNWHIDLIANRLTKASNGKLNRLIINMPPRALKSFCVSVAWPAWLLARNPNARIMVASYSQILSIKHAVDCRKIVTSNWYKQNFPETILAKDQNQKSKFMTTEGGYRFATSVLGTATGEGGNYLIVDDPHSSLQASSNVLRQKAIDWFEQTFISRLDDKKTGTIVIVMQRLHEEDLTGHLLGKKNHLWQHLKIPAIAPKDALICYGNKQITITQGEAFHHSRDNIKELENLKTELGEYIFFAQYLQNPITTSGELIKATWLNRYNEMPENFIQIIQSWDMAQKPGTNSDYSVCTSWGITDHGYYLLEVFRDKLDYPNLKKELLRSYKNINPNAILIEDKSSGSSIIQDLRKETTLPIIAINPIIGKLQRLIAVSALFEAGKVYLPKSAIWLGDYEKELLTFPRHKHDDQVDSTSQFLNYLREKNAKKPIIRRL